MAKIRTMPEAIRLVKLKDPETSFTLHALRLLVLNGEFPHIKIGAKRLVDVDLLESYLGGQQMPPHVKPESFGVVRALPERTTKFGGGSYERGNEL